MTRARDFWSRRKAAVEAEAAAELRDAALREEETARAEMEQRTDAEILAELNLPDPDRLAPGDDVTGFMARAVPERLRRRALRRLWRVNPVLANVDGLVDYGEDFTDAATVIENLATAYTVGQGMIARIADHLPQARPPDSTQPVEPPTAQPREAAQPETAQPDTATGANTAPETPTKVDIAGAAPADETDPMKTAPAPRRMRFTFEG